MTFGGLDIIVSHHIPREPWYTEIREVEAHKAILWLLKLFGISPHVCWGKVREVTRECGPYMMAGRVICGPETYAQLMDRVNDSWPHRNN